MSEALLTNEIVTFLERRAPAELARLRAEYCDERVLQPLMLGDDDDVSLKRLSAARELTLVGVRESASICKTAAEKLASRIKLGMNLQLWTQLLTTASGLGVLVSLAKTDGAIATILAIVSFMASIFGVLGAWMTSSRGASGVTASDRYANLTVGSVRLARISRELTAIEPVRVEDKSEITSLVNTANSLIEEVSALSHALA